MNQIKIGQFISERRKAVSLTQRELAERLGVTDKAVSKWETGRSMPDNSIILELCRELKIDVNELLSGEKINEENYKKKLEENVMFLMKSGEETRSKGQWSNLGIVAGFILLLLCMYFAAIVSTGTRLNFFLDIPSALIIIGITLLVLALSGKIKDFFFGFKYAITGCPEKQLVANCKKAMKLAMASNVFSAAFGFVTGIVALLSNISDISTIGPGLAVAMLSIFYGALINIFILIFYGKLD